jgi:hypothetical protein
MINLSRVCFCPKDVIIEHFTMVAPSLTAREELIVGSELRLIQGRRYGLVGKNGVGKTTLLDLIAQHKLEEFPPHLTVMHVQQEVRFSLSLSLSLFLGRGGKAGKSLLFCSATRSIVINALCLVLYFWNLVCGHRRVGTGYSFESGF